MLMSRRNFAHGFAFRTRSLARGRANVQVRRRRSHLRRRPPRARLLRGPAQGSRHVQPSDPEISGSTCADHLGRHGYGDRTPHGHRHGARSGGIGILHKNMPIEAQAGPGSQGQAVGKRDDHGPGDPAWPNASDGRSAAADEGLQDRRYSRSSTRRTTPGGHPHQPGPPLRDATCRQVGRLPHDQGRAGHGTGRHRSERGRNHPAEAQDREVARGGRRRGR